MLRIYRTAIVNIFAGILLTKSIQAQNTYKPNIFYLAVASSHYLLKNFDYLSGTKHSASRFSKLMDKFQSYGLTISSTKNQFVSKKSIADAMQVIMDSANRTQTGMNVIFVYLCGHGFTDKHTQLQFFVPGNFSISHKMIGNESKTRSECISYFDFNNYITDKKITKIILLFDCCYNAEAPNPAFSYYEQEIDRISKLDKQRQVQAKYGFDIKNGRERSFHHDQSSNKTITFSAGKPDSTVTMVDDPNDPTKVVGRLCRRFLIANSQLMSSSVSIQHLLLKVLHRDLETETFPPTHNYDLYTLSGAFMDLLPLN